MNIKILDSWLREYLKTPANPKKIAEALSLTSVSVERLEKYGQKDWTYDIEVTTNRVDLMSVIGIAREAAAVLPEFGADAEFIPLHTSTPAIPDKSSKIHIKNNPQLVNRINAVVMEVTINQSPKYVQDRLESSDIRSLNNIIDVTNYVMRETGHPCHVFDYDRLKNHTLIIREADAGEKIVTLDNKTHTLPGGDIVADNGEGEIVDLLGVMGTANSVVTDKTRRILLFLDNNEPNHIRSTSMKLGIRTEAAQINEKEVDSEIMYEAFLRAIDLYKEIADGQIVSDIIDIYPNKPERKTVSVNLQHIDDVIGVNIAAEKSLDILSKLGFEAKYTDHSISVKVPSWRTHDISIPEDLIEEIARVYGYHNLPSELPPQLDIPHYRIQEDNFYWEQRLKQMLKYWGFTEVYTYSMISKDLTENSGENMLKISNPLNEEHVYMRSTLLPSLKEVLVNHPSREQLQLFEMANTYTLRKNDLPTETITLALAIKKPQASFFEIKGFVEQMLNDIGISEFSFRQEKNSVISAAIFAGQDRVGVVKKTDSQTVAAELNVPVLLRHVSLHKTYNPIPKHPPAIEDIRLQLPSGVTYEQTVKTIKSASKLVSSVNLLDVFEDKKTFRIMYLHPNRSLKSDEITNEREKILKSVSSKLKAKQV